MSILRKTIVASVMGMTILSMCAVVAPAASAASAGDLIKMDGLSSVYYLGADNKRYVFPNEKTYFSWYSDFSTVVTVPQSELESYPLGKNVTMRPGTNLVKITTDPKVYAVEPNGNLVWVPDEDTAKALWGDSWASRVIDVPDAFFTNYTVAAGQVSATAYPAGSLVKFGEDATVYYIAEDGTARAIADEAAFLANRFMWDNVIDSSLDMPAAGTALTGEEAALTDTSSGAGGTANAGTGLTVSLSGDTPGSANLPDKATQIPVLTVNLTASNDGAVTVNNLVFKRTGTGLAADIAGAYLFLGDERLTTKRSINTTENTITFPSLSLSIPAGMTKAVTLKINGSATANSNHIFVLSSASSVTTNGATVSGSFPIQGNAMAFSSSVEAGTVTLTGSGNSTTKKIGETGVILSEFTIANNNKEDVNIYRIRLKQGGTSNDGSIGNLSLDLDGTVVKDGVSMDGKYVDFVLDSSFKLKKSKSITATVRGDILDDIGKNVQLYLKNVADIDARGTAYGDNYSAAITSSAFDQTYDDNTESDKVVIQGSEINVAFDGPQAADIKDDTTDVVLANFNIKSENLDVNIETLTVTITNGTANNHPLENFEIVDSGNGVSYSTSDSPASTTADSVYFENVYLTKGVQYNFVMRADVPDSVTAGASYQVSISFSSGFTAYFQDSDETAVSTSDLSSLTLTGKTMTVAAPAVSLSVVSTNDNTVVKDADGVLLYKGKVTATNVDDLKVSKLRFDATVGFGGGSNISADWDKLYLYEVNADGTETKLDDESSLTQTYVSFSGFTMAVPKGTSNGIYVVVRGDAKNSPTGTTTVLAWNSSSANHTIKDSDNNTVTMSISGTAGHTTTVATLGTYTLAVDTTEAGVNADKNVLAGTIAKIGRLKLTATKENATLEDLVIQNGGDATNAGVARVYLYSDKDMTELIGYADFAAGGTPKAIFEDINVEIPTAGVTYLYLGAYVKGIDYSSSPGADATATAGQTVKFRVPTNATNYVTKLVGVDTGETLAAPSATGYTNQGTVMGAIVSDVSTTFANKTFDAAGLQEIFSFKVTVPDSSNIDYDGTALGVKLATTTFTMAIGGVTVGDGYTIKRTSGSSGEKDAKTAQDTAVASSSNTFAINWIGTYGSETDADLIIRPGDTAEYVVSAIVTGISTNDTLKVTIEDIDTVGLNYVHNVATTGGSRSGNTSAVYPLISGLDNIRGGSLSK